MTEMTAPAHALASVVPSPYSVLAFANGKGGVGKTSVTANLAGLFGLAGYRVLVVELDPQGNCARDYGLPVDEYESLKDVIDANGEQHAAALLLKSASAPPPLYTEVRPNVDLIAGGGGLERIYKYYAANSKDSLADAIRWEIMSLGRPYDLILIDAPPIDITALEAVLRVAGIVIIPVKADDASIDGLPTIADSFGPAKLENPWLALGGVVRFGIGSSATRVAARASETVEQILGSTAPVFESIIRHSDSAMQDSRRHGLLAHELESASTDAKARKLAALRSGGVVATGAGTSKGLAEDYENLAAEVLARMNELISENATNDENAAAGEEI